VEKIAEQQDRIVLSRDRELLKRRRIQRGCYIHQQKPEAQLQEIFDRLDLAGHIQPFSLCISCNAPLRPIRKIDVLEQLPPNVRANHDEFSTCDVCKRLFWKGSHWKHMKELLDRTVRRPRE